MGGVLRFGTLAVGALCLLAPIVQNGAAYAQAVPARLNANDEISAALFAASATQEAALRSADARLRTQRDEIETLRSQLSQAGVGAAALREELHQKEQAFISELAARDRAYAEEIAVFRNAVTDIASTPEGLRALAQFNSGDESAALAVLDDMANARAAARLVRANIETAVEKRRIATLALEARNKGKLTTADLIVRYEEVTSLDPGMHWDWVELGRLYQAAGKLAKAADAARRASETAADDRDRSVALDGLGDALIAQGDSAGALKAYRDSLAIAERLTAADPGNADWQRDLSVSLIRVGGILLRTQMDSAGALKAYRDSLAIAERLTAADPSNFDRQQFLSLSLQKVGDALVAQGDSAGALKAYRDSLTIRERLAAADPDNYDLQRDLSISLNMLGDMLLDQGGRAGALEAYSAGLTIFERLAAADPSNFGWQRDLSVSLNRIGDVLQVQGDSAGALKAYRDSLAITERLTTIDPGDGGLLRDLSVSLDKIGDLLRAAGDSAGALKAYRDSLTIRERLAAADPDNADLQRDIWISLWRLREFPEARVKWIDIVAKMQDMQRRGTLPPTDEAFLSQARANAAREAKQ